MEITTKIIDYSSMPKTKVSTLDGKCTYCGSPAVFYTWCRKCLNDLALIKNLLQIAHRPPTED